MSLAELKPHELRSILIAAGVDPNHGVAQDAERLRMILGLLQTAGLLGIEVSASTITLFLPAAYGRERSLVLPRRLVQ